MQHLRQFALSLLTRHEQAYRVRGDWMPTSDEAQAFIDEVHGDDQELAAELEVAMVEIAVSDN